MEVSSHAMDLHRVDAVRFAVAAFTNLSQDHLDFHRTLEEYFAVKKRLFTEFDPEARWSTSTTRSDGGSPTSSARPADGRADRGAHSAVPNERPDARLSSFRLSPRRATSRFAAPGRRLQRQQRARRGGLPHVARDRADAIVAGLSPPLRCPATRAHRRGQPFAVLVDYAHTPDGLEKAIEAVSGVTPGRVITVFGCGGDRDPDKRPMMGRVAARGRPHHRHERQPSLRGPGRHHAPVEDGLRAAGASYEIEVDRRRAIDTAIDSARRGDAVLIAGKGHEDYQIFSDRTIHFDDREVAREELEAMVRATDERSPRSRGRGVAGQACTMVASRPTRARSRAAASSQPCGGATSDGHSFMGEALRAGARVMVVSRGDEEFADALVPAAQRDASLMLVDDSPLRSQHLRVDIARVSAALLLGSPARAARPRPRTSWARCWARGSPW